MSFQNAELAQPYSSLYYDYPAEDARLNADAQNRARQFGAQSAASRGSGSSRGPALNTYNRLMSDYTINQAGADRTNRLQYTNTMNALMRSPGAVEPSGLSKMGAIGGAVGGALLKEAAPDLWKRGKDAMGWNSTPQQLTQQYQTLASGDPGIGGYAYGDQAYGGMPNMETAYSGLTNAVPDFSQAYTSVDSLPWGDAASGAAGAAGSWMDALDPEVFQNLFNSGFVGW